MTANHVEGPVSVFIAWNRSHAALFHKVRATVLDTHYFALNQKAMAPILEAHETTSLPPFWTLLKGSDLEAIDREADDFAGRWRNGPYRKDALRAWIWARESAYVRKLLAALEAKLGSRPRYVVPRLALPQNADWHGATMVPQAVMEEWVQEGQATVVWIAAPVPETRSQLPPPAQFVFTIEEMFGRPWILFSTFGVPDLSFHLDVTFRGGAETLLLFLDAHESGPLPSIYSHLTAAQRRIRVLAPFVEAAPTFDGAVQPPEGTGRVGQWILRTRNDMSPALVCLEKLFAQSPPELCVVSDHDCPQNVLLASFCADKNVPLLAIPHSSWPMEGPFLARPPAGYRKWTYVAATRRAAAHLAEQLGQKATIARRSMPSPRYRISLRRLMRVVMKSLSPSRRVLRIGVVITSGEAIVAPDVLLGSIVGELRALLHTPARFSGYVRFHIRLRETEDRSAVLANLAGEEGKSVVWEESCERAPISFLRDMDLVIEIGTPGSIMLESFAEMVPFFRIGAPGRRRVGFALPTTLVPRLSSEAPWRDLAPFIQKPRRRKVLAWRQFLFLLTVGGLASPGSVRLNAGRCARKPIPRALSIKRVDTK